MVPSSINESHGPIMISINFHLSHRGSPVSKERAAAQVDLGVSWAGRRGSVNSEMAGGALAGAYKLSASQHGAKVPPQWLPLT